MQTTNKTVGSNFIDLLLYWRYYVHTQLEIDCNGSSRTKSFIPAMLLDILGILTLLRHS